MHIFAYMHIKEVCIKKNTIAVIFGIILLGNVTGINAYYLPPRTFHKRILLLKMFNFYSDFQSDNSFASVTGFKEQYGITDNINIYAKQSVFIYKKMGMKIGKGFGDMRQGIILKLPDFRKRNNIEAIISLKIPTGYVAKSNGEISLGSGTYDTYFEILGNYFYRLLELRYYTSFVKKIGNNINISESDNFLTVAGHLFKGKVVLMSSLTYNYRFNDKSYNSTFIEELLYKFNRRIFIKAGGFIPVEENNIVKSNYKILAEFYYFLY